MEDAGGPEFSVVIPCLDEAETIGRCVEKARQSFERLGLAGEVVVADNGSSDGSPSVAERAGARVVPVPSRGYGNALRGGIAAARGRGVIMGDGDDSYDFSDLAPFVEKLRGGFDLVMGNRFKGAILPGAMPWKHRWLGNPVLSALGRIFFRSPVGDFHCGLRAFTMDAWRRMDLRTPGMEFASEMVIKATLLGMRIAEVPVVLRKDGRSRPPHLQSWRDGWRHLRFMLLFSPRWLFLVPGLAMSLAGLLGGLWLLGGPRRVAGVELDVHSLLAASLLCVLGLQLVVFWAFTRTFAAAQGLHPPDRSFERLGRIFTLERGVLAGLVLGAAGLVFLLLAVGGWWKGGFGPLDPRQSMRRMIPAVTLLALGAQVVFASFFLSILRLAERPGAGDDRPLTPRRG